MKKESKPENNDPRANHQTRKPPKFPSGFCALHGFYLNWFFIRKRGCVVPRFCHHFWWCDAAGNLTHKLSPKPSNQESERKEETSCPESL